MEKELVKVAVSIDEPTKRFVQILGKLNGFNQPVEIATILNNTQLNVDELSTSAALAEKRGLTVFDRDKNTIALLPAAARLPIDSW